jgi:cation:H+ antiporter
MLAMATPPLGILSVHPVTPVLVAAYLFGLYLVHHTQAKPMWFPRQTHETVSDTPDPQQQGSLLRAWLGFIALAVVTGIAGWALMEAAKGIADQTGLSDTVVGGMLTALATSTPELVTTVAAIRCGALTLGVSNIFGTNCFNLLVVAAADVGYPHGSIYHDVAPVQMIWGLVTILMSAILLLGMLRRETYGIGRIGFESALILVVYGVALGLIVASS